MNQTIRSMTVLALMFGVGASAQEPTCQSSLSIAEAVAAMGEGVVAQPVYAGSGLKGFRLYGTRNSSQLTSQAINPGDLMTHVCGISANEIHAKGGNICCNYDASREFVVSFRIADQERKVLIRRP
jgi:hypothetical protein